MHTSLKTIVLYPTRLLITQSSFLPYLDFSKPFWVHCLLMAKSIIWDNEPLRDKHLIVFTVKQCKQVEPISYHKAQRWSDDMLFRKYFFPSASYSYNQTFINHVDRVQMQYSKLHKGMKINLYFSKKKHRSVTITNFSVPKQTRKPLYC